MAALLWRQLASPEEIKLMPRSEVVQPSRWCHGFRLQGHNPDPESQLADRVNPCRVQWWLWRQVGTITKNVLAQSCRAETVLCDRILVNGDNDRSLRNIGPSPKVKKKTKKKGRKKPAWAMRGKQMQKEKKAFPKRRSHVPPPFSFPSTRLVPSFPPLLARPINFWVHNAHVPCKRIIPRKGFLFSTEMTADLLLAGIVYCIFVTS